MRKYFCAVDRKFYDSASDIPDYGNWVCTDNDGNCVHLIGLASDIDKLPLNVAPMSTAICNDNQRVYCFNGKIKQWTLM